MTRDVQRETEVAIGALENCARLWREDGADYLREWAATADDVATDLRSGETTLANCGDDECSHGWHYTEHGGVQAMLLDLGGRSALALLLSVLMVCATLLLLADMILHGGAPTIVAPGAP